MAYPGHGLGVFLSSLLQGAPGFGFGLFAMGLLPLFLPLEVVSMAVPLLLIPLLIVNFATLRLQDRLRSIRQHVGFKIAVSN